MLWGSAPTVPSVAASLGCQCPRGEAVISPSHPPVFPLSSAPTDATPSLLVLGLRVPVPESPCAQEVTGPSCQEGPPSVSPGRPRGLGVPLPPKGTV